MVLVFFFFQAEDGIRDYKVTGVQTCALPISWNAEAGRINGTEDGRLTACHCVGHVRLPSSSGARRPPVAKKRGPVEAGSGGEESASHQRRPGGRADRLGRRNGGGRRSAHCGPSGAG